MRVRVLATGLIVSSVAVSTAAQQPTKPSEEQRAATYLAEKQKIQREFQASLASLGRGQDAGQMAQGVRSKHPPQGRKLKHSAATDAALDDMFYKDVALELSSLGFSNGDLQGTRGAALVRAAIAKRTAAADYSDLALLSDVVAIGTVESVDVGRAQSDGLGGRATVRLDEVVKGKMRQGDTLAIVLVSGGRDASGNILLDAHEYLPAAGSRVALLGSRAAYDANRTWRGRGGPSAAPTAMRLVNLLGISGDRVISNDDFLADTTLGAFRSLGGQQ